MSQSLDAPATAPLLPLVRHLSSRTTPYLLRTSLSANQITTLSLLAGLAAIGLLSTGEWWHQVASGVALTVCYILDNCDGEVARARSQSSEFGRHYDTAVDWVVHSGLFIALGAGQTAVSGASWWWYAGLAAGLGGTINYFLGLYFDARDAVSSTSEHPGAAPRPVTPLEWVLFAFRELTRADFCFLVLVLSVADVLWFLLPAGAIGAQVYWLTLCINRVRRFHV